MVSAIDIITVASGGALGATLRFCTQKALAIESRWSLIIVNLAGCLLIGVAWGLLERITTIPRWLPLLIVPGFLGGFTTFSSFSFDTFTMIRTGHAAEAIIYVTLTVVGGLILTWIGWQLASQTMENC